MSPVVPSWPILCMETMIAIKIHQNYNCFNNVIIFFVLKYCEWDFELKWWKTKLVLFQVKKQCIHEQAYAVLFIINAIHRKNCLTWTVSSKSSNLLWIALPIPTLDICCTFTAYCIVCNVARARHHFDESPHVFLTLWRPG